MLRITQNAVATLDATKRQQEIPAEYGLRVSGAVSPSGEASFQIGFAAAPADTDAVGEQHGMKLFVAQEVAEPLAGAELDVTTAGGNSDAPTQLVLRPAQPE